MASLFLVLLPGVGEAAEIPLTLLSSHTDVTDLDAVYDAAGRLHVCGLRANGDVRYWRYSAAGKVEQSNLAMEQCAGGCAIATKQYGSYERPVIVSWSNVPFGSGFQVVETHDTSETDVPYWPTAQTTNILTPDSQQESSLTPPALTRYLGSGGANHALIVAGATSVGVKLTTQQAGVPTWLPSSYVETFGNGYNVAAVTLTADYVSLQNRWHLAYVWNRYWNSGGFTWSNHNFELHTRVENGGTTQPYGTKTLAGSYPGTTISLASDGSAPWLGFTRREEGYVDGLWTYWIFAAVSRPQAGGDWPIREVSVKQENQRQGDHVKVAFLDGTLTASYVNEENDLRVFAGFDGTHDGCTSPFTGASCWRRQSMLIDTATPVLGRTAVATRSTTATTAAYVVAQNQAVSSSTYPGAAMSMTARIPQLACSTFLPVFEGYTFGPPKLVGDGSTWFAVYKKTSGLNTGLAVKKWNPTDLDGDAWDDEQDIVAPSAGAVGEWDATFDGTNLQAAWINTFYDQVKRREWSGSGSMDPAETVDTGVTDTGVVRIAAGSGRLSFAYPKSGDVYYRELGPSGWSAAHAVLNDWYYSYRVLSVGLAADPSDGERRVVGVLSTGSLKTAVCTLSTCDAAGDWSGFSSLGAPNVTGGAWLDHRLGVAFSADGGRVGIVGGGTSTSLPGKAKLYLHESTGSGFAASPLEIDTGAANLAYTASGRFADLRYDANGNWKAVHFDTTNGEVRAVRQWLPGTGTAARDVVRWTGPMGQTPEVRMSVDTSGQGFGIFGAQDNYSYSSRLLCEPTVF